MPKKRILILTAGFGEGHNAAARGLEAGFKAVAADAAEAEVHDLFAETYGRLNDWSRRAYLTLINRAPAVWEAVYDWVDRSDRFPEKLGFLFSLQRRLHQLLTRFRPDAVVSVYPAYAHLIGKIIRGGAAPFRHIVCITDSITVNAIWFRCAADLFLLPNEQTEDVLARAGVPRARLRVTGFPVLPAFAELGELRTSAAREPLRRVLYMLNAQRKEARETIHQLVRLKSVTLIVTVGRDVRLRRAIEAIRDETKGAFEVVGWTDQLPRLMLEAHLLISKAGGATVQEAIAAKCPIVINQVVPGQEEGNARLIQATGAGVVATRPADIVAAIEGAFADECRVWSRWSGNIGRVSRPAASLDIARLLSA